jgi:iron complex outermembrane recepter protein
MRCAQVMFGATLTLHAVGGYAQPPLDTDSIGEVVVTARRRTEPLQDVPIAVTSLSGLQLQERQIVSVKDIAALAPGLNINSDSAARSFVSIRGIGTTLINTVQPGVGIFLNGVYQPDTSYLDSPLVDVERIEVLRGPQGTLFGNNTLGGAINVITREPGNDVERKVSGAYAGPDDYHSAAVSISGPLIADILQARLALADHSQDGFGRNTHAGSYSNPLSQRSANTTVRWQAAPPAIFTFNAYYNRVSGGSTPYSQVVGTTDYRRDLSTNQNSTVTLAYRGANLKGVFDLPDLSTTMTAVLAYDRRDDSSSVDGDYGPVDFLRAAGTGDLETKTVELRFDTHVAAGFSTLLGVFASRVAGGTEAVTLLVPLNLMVPLDANSEANAQAVFGTAFWQFARGWELAAGLRYDHQVLGASNDSTAAAYKASEWEPRVTLTRRWYDGLMTYASVARGFRGGGQNGPGAPSLVYKGDSVVTSELGAKMQPLDRLTVDTDVFFNNYAHFIGQNALAPSTSGVGFVAINLNSGHVKSYGFEVETHFKATARWRLDGGLTLLHARITNDSEYVQETGMALASDRILFTPAWNYNLDSSYTLPIGDFGSVELMLGAIAKGTRAGSSLSSDHSPELSPYTLINGSIAYRRGAWEAALFATNLFDKKYFESYLDSSALAAAGLPRPLVSDLGLEGDRRRVGIRGSWRF